MNTFPNIEKKVENATRSRAILTNFGLFVNVVKQCLECLIYGENREVKSQKTYATQTFFKLDELFMNLRTSGST